MEWYMTAFCHCNKWLSGWQLLCVLFSIWQEQDPKIAFRLGKEIRARMAVYHVKIVRHQKTIQNYVNAQMLLYSSLGDIMEIPVVFHKGINVILLVLIIQMNKNWHETVKKEQKYQDISKNLFILKHFKASLYMWDIYCIGTASQEKNQRSKHLLVNQCLKVKVHPKI